MNPSTVPEGRFERTFAVSGRVSLDAEVESGVIRVTAGAAGSVQIRGIVRARRSFFGWGDAAEHIWEVEADPPVEQHGDTIRVGPLSGGWLGGHIVLLVEVTAPQDTAVRARSEAGDITITGVYGPVDCEADSGRIEVTDIAGEVRAEADSGRIRLARVNGPVYAEADSGSIEALDMGGPVEARADSGFIRITQTAAAPVRAEADSGSIQVRLAPDAGYTVRARADSGEIKLPAMCSWKGSGNDVRGQIGGGGPLVDLETDSGDIEVL